MKTLRTVCHQVVALWGELAGPDEHHMRVCMSQMVYAHFHCLVDLEEGGSLYHMEAQEVLA